MEGVEREVVGIACADSPRSYLPPRRAARHIVRDASIDERDDLFPREQRSERRIHRRVVAGHVIVEQTRNRGGEADAVDHVGARRLCVRVQHDLLGDAGIDELHQPDELDGDLRAHLQGPRTLVFMIMNAAFAPTRTDFDWLSRDPEEVDRYVADPLCGFTVADASLASMGADAFAFSQPDATARVRSGLPIYVFSGDRDPVGADGKGVELVTTRYREAGVEDVFLRLYPDARHELLNETNRDEVTEDFLAWAGRFLRAFGE